MRVHVVSDVHARADALAKAGDGADALICLGDLVLFLDYDDPGGGIFADLFAAMPTPAYVTYGNVDVPALYAEYVRDGITVLDGETAVIGGRRFGFVGGGLRTPMRTPYEIDDDEYAAKVAGLGRVDVLC